MPLASMRAILAVIMIAIATAPSASRGGVLDESALTEAKRAALDGDSAAALNVAFHYGELSERRHPMSFFWYQIAAENGDPNSMLLFATQLILRSPENGGCRRAKYWLREASRLGRDERFRNNYEGVLRLMKESKSCMGIALP
jgi:TPR repeat protein